MKVLHICPYMHPSAGGPPIVVERLCEEMAELGWGASLITTSQFCQDDGRQLQTDLRSRIDARVLPLDRPRLLGSASGARPMIEDQIAQADIVHIHTLWHPFNGMARMACARTRTPYVTMPHGMLDPYSLGVKPFRKKLYLKLTEQATLRQASRIVFTTPLEEQLARASAPWLGASEVVPLGADSPPGDSREALAEKFVTEFPDASGRRCLLFLGRLHPKKGIEHLIQILPAVLSEHPDSVLVIAGTGDESYVRRLKAQVAGTQLTSHVLFAGLVLDELKWGALAAAEIFPNCVSAAEICWASEASFFSCSGVGSGRVGVGVARVKCEYIPASSMLLKNAKSW